LGTSGNAATVAVIVTVSVAVTVTVTWSVDRPVLDIVRLSR
jgi:hypothetical protein